MPFDPEEHPANRGLGLPVHLFRADERLIRKRAKRLSELAYEKYRRELEEAIQRRQIKCEQQQVDEWLPPELQKELET